MANDPFSASIIPFEVPEQVRAFAEKGVSQARVSFLLTAVIVVHDVRGLTDHYRDITRRFASEGFFALALDLYSREGAPELPTMEAVFTNASKGASTYSAKLVEFMKANTTTSLDFAQELFGVKTPAEALELWTSHTRKQFETLTAQAKELAELSQKVATETVEPIKATASKYYKPAA